MADQIDPRAGILFRKKIGDRIDSGECLAVILTEKPGTADEASRVLRELIHIGPAPVQRKPVILSMVDKDGERPWSPPVQY